MPNLISLGLTGSKRYYLHACHDQSNAEFDDVRVDWVKMALLPCLTCSIKILPNLIPKGLTGSKWYYLQLH